MLSWSKHHLECCASAVFVKPTTYIVRLIETGIAGHRNEEMKRRLLLFALLPQTRQESFVVDGDVVVVVVVVAVVVVVGDDNSCRAENDGETKGQKILNGKWKQN